MHPDLKIAIPRNIGKGHKTAQAYWDLVRAHGTSRRKMVDFICSIGGYYGHGDGRHAIEFNVSTWQANLDAEHLWKRLVSEGEFDLKELPPAHFVIAKALFMRVHKEHEKHLWEWASEEAYEGWRDSDSPYETFTGRRVDWSHTLLGRGGKHLCMTECAGVNLHRSVEDLNEALMDGDGEMRSRGYDITHAQVRDLFIICVQNTVDLTTKNVGQEVEYRAMWRLWVSFCEDELKSEISSYESREQLSEDAGGILTMLEDMRADGSLYADTFKEICKLADIQIGE